MYFPGSHDYNDGERDGHCHHGRPWFACTACEAEDRAYNEREFDLAAAHERDMIARREEDAELRHIIASEGDDPWSESLARTASAIPAANAGSIGETLTRLRDFTRRAAALAGDDDARRDVDEWNAARYGEVEF